MPSKVASLPEESVPLCVDLDGTLIRTDVLWVSMGLLIKRNPLFLLAVPLWFLGGRAAMKKEIAMRTELNTASLRYNEGFLTFLKLERARRRRLVLATAADRRQAEQVAAFVGIFDEVVASDGQTNMRGRNKAETLVKLFGRKGFDYAGNSTVDLPVWQEARRAIVVNASDRLADRARRCTEVSAVFD